MDTIASKEDSYSKKLLSQLEIQGLVCQVPTRQAAWPFFACRQRSKSEVLSEQSEKSTSGVWSIQTKKMKLPVLDRRLTATVLVARAVLANERIFMLRNYA